MKLERSMTEEVSRSYYIVLEDLKARREILRFVIDYLQDLCAQGGRKPSELLKETEK